MQKVSGSSPAGSDAADYVGVVCIGELTVVFCLHLFIWSRVRVQSDPVLVAVSDPI
jgi:hypothetical protein